MKFIISISLVFIIVYFGTSFIPTKQHALDKGLVAYYNFNDCQARDLTGNANDGDLQGGVGCWCGIEGEGLLFNGQNSSVVFAGDVNHVFGTTDFSISFYFKSEQYSIFHQSLLNKREICDDEYLLDISFISSSSEIRTNFRESTYRYYRDLDMKKDSLSWTHYALVREGQTAKVYLNGQMIKEDFSCRGVDISNTSVLNFSGSPCIGEGRFLPFKGVLDQMRIYDRALSDEEVMSIYSIYPIENANQDCAS